MTRIKKIRSQHDTCPIDYVVNMIHPSVGWSPPIWGMRATTKNVNLDRQVHTRKRISGFLLFLRMKFLQVLFVHVRISLGSFCSYVKELPGVFFWGDKRLYPTQNETRLVLTSLAESVLDKYLSERFVLSTNKTDSRKIVRYFFLCMKIDSTDNSTVTMNDNFEGVV